MSMTTNSPPERINWEDHVKSWQASGLPMTRYCQKHNLAVHQFGYYKRKLDSASAASTKSNKGFVQVVTTKNKVSQGLVLRLASGFVIENISSQNLPLIKALLRELS